MCLKTLQESLMAKQIGARKDGSYELMCAFPSIEYNVAWIPTPFPVKYNLGSAQNVSSNFMN